MMTQDNACYDTDTVIAHYDGLLSRHGQSHRSLYWGSAASQQLRFQVLSEVGDLRGAVVLDVGCGLGDLNGYLCEKGMDVRYTGWDLTPSMVTAARQRFPHLNFENRNILAPDADPIDEGKRADYVFSSGLFTFADDGFLRQAVGKMYALCDKALAFNTLSSIALDKDAGEYYADPMTVLNFCLSITPWVTLRHDYMPHDFTVYMYRRQHR